ncbi:hypothetical protein V3468_11900 [Flavobacterium oreochromis]|uniref:hypothetical protein n=1 Tax=Flavobacterium oreochromis TaxID=2906078 RepID=UPI0038595584
MKFKKNLFTLIAFFFWNICAKKVFKKEILLNGVFHFNNPGQDLTKYKKIDVLNDAS